MPAWSAPSIMPSRAARLPGSAQAIGRLVQITFIAASAMPSLKGLARRET